MLLLQVEKSPALRGDVTCFDDEQHIKSWRRCCLANRCGWGQGWRHSVCERILREAEFDVPLLEVIRMSSSARPDQRHRGNVAGVERVDCDLVHMR